MIKVIMKPAIYLFFLIASIPVFSQQQQYEKFYLFNNYNLRNGLINNVVYSIGQDGQGFMWLSSDLGLTRFDGKNFFHKAIPEIYDIPSAVHNIETTNKGNITFTSMHGAFEQCQ